MITEATQSDWNDFWSGPTPSDVPTVIKQSPNEQDLDQLVENYVTHIVDGMDIASLEQMCYDLLTREYEKLTWDEITEEIVDLYDEDTLINLIPDANG
ncbi:hypothetical protein [Synechococcus phage S-MS29]|nr:hypothetical protein [Synechococcus phage S-MS29]